jgi:FkbM family methyltransferase
LFYESGSRGVNVEPDPALYRRICRHRKRDVNLMLGVGPQAGELELLIMSSSTLNTFSSAEAAAYEQQGFAIVDRRRVRMITPPELIDRYCSTVPEFVSIDVEGLDYAILEAFDFSRHRPLVLCVESLTFSTTGEGRKIAKIQPLLESSGYFLYADTHINSIYVDESRWRRPRG